MHPKLIFATGQVRQQNGGKPSKTWVLDWKKWKGLACCKKTRNDSRGINSCIKCASIPVFAMCQLRLWNGMEPPKTWVLDWNSGLGMFVVTNKKWFWRHKLVHLMHPILIFTMGQVRQRSDVKPPETQVLDVKYVVRNQTDILEHWNGVKIPKMWVLDLKECIEIFQVVCLESCYSETFNQMHADTSFHNGTGASTKWRETTENGLIWLLLWLVLSLGLMAMIALIALCTWLT